MISMILPIILHHDNSKQYTDDLVERLKPRKAFVIDSSKLGTQFTDSFNLALNVFLHSKFSHVMVCNNDIDLDYEELHALQKVIYNRQGIFSPIVNSPHRLVMSRVGDEELRIVPWVEFVCPIISKNVVKDIGLLDSNITLGWGIELDYCYRAEIVGYRTKLIQTVDVHHYGHKSQSDHSEYSHYANIEMNGRLREKYGDNWQEVLKYPQW